MASASSQLGSLAGTQEHNGISKGLSTVEASDRRDTEGENVRKAGVKSRWSSGQACGQCEEEG